MILKLLGLAFYGWFAYALGGWHRDREHMRAMRKTLSVIGRDKPVKLARAVAQPAIVRREPWEAWRS